jgi:mannose-6-phosphate isomerase-like protein (cupin superfamily)
MDNINYIRVPSRGESYRIKIPFNAKPTYMKRSVFLQIPLVASALIANAKNFSKDRANKGIKVEAGKDRFQEELLIMGGQFECKVSGKDTDGDLCIYDTLRQEKGGPALHLHHNQDEWFYIIKGEFIAKIGEELFHLKAGDSAFAPRKIAHAFAKISDEEGQMLILFQPAGSMEDYFQQVSKLGGSIQDQAHGSKDLMKTHGMEVVGPPLTF